MSLGGLFCGVWRPPSLRELFPLGFPLSRQWRCHVMSTLLRTPSSQWYIKNGHHSKNWKETGSPRRAVQGQESSAFSVSPEYTFMAAGVLRVVFFYNVASGVLLTVSLSSLTSSQQLKQTLLHLFSCLHRVFPCYGFTSEVSTMTHMSHPSSLSLFVQ